MPYQPWTKELEAELVALAVISCRMAEHEEAWIGDWLIMTSINGRPSIVHDPRGSNQLVFSTSPGQKKVVKKRECAKVLRALRAHLVLESLARIKP